MDKQIWDQVAISFEQSTFDENKGPRSDSDNQY